MVGIRNEETKEDFLFKYPVLSFIEETQKIMLMNEIELVYWKIVLQKYLQAFANDPHALKSQTADIIRLIFFQCAMHIKKFLLLQYKAKGLDIYHFERRKEQIECIESYIKEYHFKNFDEVYGEFDQPSNILLSTQFESLRGKTYASDYESMSFLID